MKALWRTASFLSCLAFVACDSAAPATKPPAAESLAAGGVYVAYNLGCDQGCESVAKGDLLQQVDGKPVATAADIGDLADGKPHVLDILRGTAASKVTVVATPKTNMPPLENVPPFWLVGAKELDRAPAWARQRMFGHASPSVMLVNSDGGIIDGRQLFGKKRLIVYWDWGDREEEASAIDLMQVLQKARADLEAKGVEVMFVHVHFPNGRKAPMNDSDLRAWEAKWAVQINGVAAPPLTTFRFPNQTEFNAAREVGMENAFTVFENLGRSPAIVLLDERGIVRWHSEGTTDIGATDMDQDQATIIAAVEFGLGSL